MDNLQVLQKDTVWQEESSLCHRVMNMMLHGAEALMYPYNTYRRILEIYKKGSI
jgi:hypothetical protein